MTDRVKCVTAGIPFWCGEVSVGVPKHGLAKRLNMPGGSLVGHCAYSQMEVCLHAGTWVRFVS